MEKNTLKNRDRSVLKPLSASKNQILDLVTYVFSYTPSNYLVVLSNFVKYFFITTMLYHSFAINHSHIFFNNMFEENTWIAIVSEVPQKWFSSTPDTLWVVWNKSATSSGRRSRKRSTDLSGHTNTSETKLVKGKTCSTKHWETKYLKK